MEEVKLDEDMAEFLGILTGDGCVNRYERFSNKKRIDYYVSISGNSIKDKLYYDEFVIPKLRKIFKVNSRYYKKKNQNTIELMIRYKKGFEYLMSIGFNKGPKDFIDVPKEIREDKKLFLSFIRGLFDTDGCISWKNGEYPVITISQKSRRLIESLSNFLEENNFNIHTELDRKTKDKRGFESKGSKVYISGRKNLDKWKMLIGSNHPLKIEKMNGVRGSFLEPFQVPI